MMIDIFNHFMPKAYLDRLGAWVRRKGDRCSAEQASETEARRHSHFTHGHSSLRWFNVFLSGHCGGSQLKETTGAISDTGLAQRNGALQTSCCTVPA